MKFLFDYFPIICFFIAYKLYGIFVATAVTMLASIIQVGFFWLRHRRFEKVHLMAFALPFLTTWLINTKGCLLWVAFHL